MNNIENNLKIFFSNGVNIIVTFLLLSLHSICQAEYSWPLKEKSYLTGTFGEFRKNHIHAGIDISTKGKIGLPVYAGDKGKLYRVKTQYKGFGKTVYLKLSSGKFLVYAHLDKFSPKIEKIIKLEQVKKNKYEVDVYPHTKNFSRGIHPTSKIQIDKGELIGYSGDTGGVFPHLHLELRDKKERPINILKNGLTISDKSSPFREDIKYIDKKNDITKKPAQKVIQYKKGLDKKRPIIKGLAVCNPETSFVTANYSVNNISKIAVYGPTGLALSVYEESHGNRLGVYKIDLIVDGKLFFRVQMDSFSYDEFRDNFFVYNKDIYVSYNKIYYNLFRTFNNNLPFYPLNTNGILNLKPGEHSITIKAEDYSGNASKINFILAVKQQKSTIPKKEEHGPWKSSDGNLSLKIENLYSPVDIQIKTSSEKLTQEGLEPISKVYIITPEASVFKNAYIYIKPPFKSEKIGLYRFDKNKWKYIEDNKANNLGKFCLFLDSTPPVIKIVSPFRAKITDNGSGLDYNKSALYLDGKRLIAEYSINKKELFYEGNLKPGKHRVKWIAFDRAGNKAEKEMLYD